MASTPGPGPWQGGECQRRGPRALSHSGALPPRPAAARATGRDQAASGRLGATCAVACILGSKGSLGPEARAAGTRRLATARARASKPRWPGTVEPSTWPRPPPTGRLAAPGGVCTGASGLGRGSDIATEWQSESGVCGRLGPSAACALAGHIRSAAAAATQARSPGRDFGPGASPLVDAAPISRSLTTSGECAPQRGL